MKNTKSEKAVLEKIRLLIAFRGNLYSWLNGHHDLADQHQLRQQIEQNVEDVRKIAAEARCLRLVPANPPLPGKIIVRDCDPFNFVLKPSCYGVSFIPTIIEIVEESIAILQGSKVSFLDEV